MAEPKVLIADDEPFVVRPLALVLRREGFAVVEARDGEEAIAVALREQPQLAFLDVTMPRRDGFEVVAALRERAETRRCRFVLITGRGGPDDRERAVALGCDDLMIKPFSPLRVVEWARLVLHAGAPRS